ncbi:MAG: ABC transporter ATP-binding protein [Candidatus Eremiobacteraeota bacterium]|nr:ABC transporter ATP-binding protein [Candidatus Eremiobacteraeota bacterium]
MRGIRKTYPGVVAVNGVDLDLFPGEIHALVGENGAGKSTLANIAFGEVRADAGTIQASGTVGLVHQHFELVGRLRVWQNIVLGREPRNGIRIDEAAARKLVTDLAAKNGLEIDPDAFVEDLPIGVQQRVELLRELEREPTVLLLDEPTAALAPAEIDSFFKTITALAARGTAIMIVTHKLQEVIAYSHRISVMRHGTIVANLDTHSTSIDDIARAMVGGDLPPVAEREPTTTAPCLTITDVSAGTGGGKADGVTLEVRNGEIVGIAGVEGNGQTALADAIAKMIDYRGTIDLDGYPAIVPQDRHREALVMSWSIVDNAVLGRQHDPGIQKGLLLDGSRARADAEAIKERFDVRCANLDVAVRTLSGGNQQKIVVGRALIDNPKFVLAYNPTRGIDVGAAALVQSRLMQARNAGAAILLISFELDEILTLADRILVMYRGKVVGNFERARVDRGAIGRLMAGSAA